MMGRGGLTGLEQCTYSKMQHRPAKKRKGCEKSKDIEEEQQRAYHEQQRRRMQKEEDQKSEFLRKKQMEECRDFKVQEYESKLIFLRYSREGNLLSADMEYIVLGYCGWNISITEQRSTPIDVDNSKVSIMGLIEYFTFKRKIRWIVLLCLGTSLSNTTFGAGTHKLRNWAMQK